MGDKIWTYMTKCRSILNGVCLPIPAHPLQKIFLTNKIMPKVRLELTQQTASMLHSTIELFELIID